MYRDKLEESWVYQEILREGHEKGLTEGLEKGQATGEQRALLALIQKRFPAILQVATKRISTITDTFRLENLIGELSIAQTSEEALQMLNTFDAQKNGDNGKSGAS